jgi:hypothetical protein
MDFNDVMRMRSRLTPLDLFVAELPAVGTWLVAWMAVEKLAVQYRELGLTPEGLGATLFGSPSLLLAWPALVALAWAALRGNASNRGKLNTIAYGGSAILFGGCYFVWNAPIINAAVDALH